MELRGTASDSFELRIIGYKSSQVGEDVREANWLLVHTRACIDGRPWQAIDPCLLAWEVVELAEWADAISREPPAKAELTFLAPNLWFELQRWSEEQIDLRVYFDRKQRPPWLEWSNATGETWADLSCTPAELKDWSAELHRQAEKFPPRGKAAAHPNVR